VRAIRIEKFGGPEVLQIVDIEKPIAGENDVLIRVGAAGINYADTHQTEDSYLAPQQLPLIPGAEVVGFDPEGKRVVALVPGGGYAEFVAAPRPLTFEIPDGVSDGAALATILQGTTAWHILHTCAHIQSSETVVIHAAAGGVGSYAVQLAQRLGARVIATVSSKEKAEVVKGLGVEKIVIADGSHLAEQILEMNAGKKVNVVLEMVGGSTFTESLRVLAPFGRLVTYGMASRTQPEPVQVGSLMAHSHAVIGFWLAHCMSRPDKLLTPVVHELFEMIARREITPVVGKHWPLESAMTAHQQMRSRSTVGKTYLTL
jgi:NADPH2:quinone reductase